MELVQNYEELAPRGLAVDNTLLTTAWLMLTILFGVLGWELVKWSVLTTTRRARRLMRLRDRTAEVVQREVHRQWAARDRPEDEPLREDLSRSFPEAKSRSRGSTTRRSARDPTDRSQRDTPVVQPARGSDEVPREETVVRGLYERRRRLPPRDAIIQTDPWEPPVVVREIPIEVPSRESSLLGDFEPLPETFVVTQFGEHYHCSSQCDGLRKARTQPRNISPCLACLGNIQLFKRRRSFRRLTPSHTG